jgi:hypothetical protein
MKTFVFALASYRRDRFQPLGSGSVLVRGWHSIAYTIMASNSTFNWSGLPASFASAGLSNAYQPVEQRTWTASLERAGTGTLGCVLGNLWLEFTQKNIEERGRLRRVVKSR